MATNFTNKYMQVFQNYNEFGEHSADYVRGEDHIAFLIEENEVIYWLYLEQVWRPLNVRTTTTGELEDGRTKVAVRLEYIEGGQKYTSVPNIPDPERITSMSRFLKDYPDIEEVNVSGTVNLTDLSYAFASSKIKDFSMLDTSNVDNIYGFINNISNNDLIIKFSTNKALDDFKISDVDINKLTITANRKNDNSLWSFIDFNCDELELISNKEQYSKITVSGSSIDTIKNENGQVTLQYSADGGYNNFINNVYAFITRINCDSITAESININGDTCILYESSRDTYNFKYKAFVNVNNLIIGTGSNYQMYIQFGSGIKYNEDVNIDINIANNRYIPSFIFTTPIVDDTFYAKYAQYNIPISIFQYKTTFTEVADVNITEATDSSLIYVDWNSIDFDTSKISVEINNNVACTLDTRYNSNYNVFKKLIIDNSKIDLGDDVDNYPSIRSVNINCTADECVRNIDFDNYKISGRYRNDSRKVINDSRFKDIIIYCNNKVYETTIDAELDFNTERNIKIYNYSNIELYVNNVNKQNVNYRIDSLIENNELNISFIPSSNNCGTSFKFYINYVEGVKLTIKANSVLTIYRNWLEHSTADNPVIVNGILQNTFSITTNFNYYTIPLESCYMNFSDNGYIQYVDGGKANKNFDAVVSKNFYGIINIKLSGYIPGANYTDCGIKHIDLNKVLTGSGSAGDNILRYQSCDDETTINLITKLVDNTSSSTATIYMYRSQANIIGEENIAAAVAKNYEIAIIEN